MNELSPWRIHRLAKPEDQQPEHGYPSELDQISLSAYWNILVKRRAVILSIFLVVFAAGSYFALSATTLYTASATVKIEPQNPRVTGVGEFQPLELRGDYDYHQTQFALLRSRPLAARVITELGLESKKSFTNATIVSPNPVHHVTSWINRPLRSFFRYLAPLFQSRPERDESQAIDSIASIGTGGLELTVAPALIDQYLGFINIAPIKLTRLVRVEFTTPDPALSQALSNAHVQTFMRMSLESRFSLTLEAREFLDQKKNELRQKLERSDAEMNRFRRAHGVLSVEKGENIVVDRLIDLNKQLTGARAQRIEAESLSRTVENRSYQDLAEIMKQGLVQQLKSNIANLEAEKARIATILKPDHPRIQELNQQLAAASQAFNYEVANVVRGIKANYAAALAKERALEGEAGKQQQDALKLRELGVQYTVLQEEVNANRTLYESVLKRLSETNVSNDLAVSNMQIAERAAKPLRASGPNVPLYLLVSMVSGLFLGVGVAFLREFLDSTVGTPEEVWRSVGLGTLGVVPHLKFLEGRKHGGQLDHAAGRREDPLLLTKNRPLAKDLIISHHPLSILAESYRSIRTALLFSQPEKPPKVILLTSPSPAEGKTQSTLNLAIALAQDGHNVLVIDADLRKGTCHARLGITNHNGLSNVLTGKLALEEAVRSTPINGLSLLSRGIRSPNPTDLLGSPKMRQIVSKLRESFTFILIDSPPAVVVSDAAVLSVLCDGVLLVFNGQKTTKACARQAMERLDSVRAPFLGAILNSVDLRNPEYAYFRYYYGSDYASIGESGNGAASHVAALTEELHEVEARLEELAPGAVPQAFFDHMTSKLTEAAGPMAPLIVRDNIARLGESRAAFPRNRVKELLELVSREIVNERIRDDFCRRMQKDLTARSRSVLSRVVDS